MLIKTAKTLRLNMAWAIPHYPATPSNVLRFHPTTLPAQLIFHASHPSSPTVNTLYSPYKLSSLSHPKFNFRSSPPLLSFSHPFTPHRLHHPSGLEFIVRDQNQSRLSSPCDLSRSVANPRFPRGWTVGGGGEGFQPMRRGRKHVMWQNFCLKLHENERNWLRWGASPLSRIHQCLLPQSNWEYGSMYCELDAVAVFSGPI